MPCRQTSRRMIRQKIYCEPAGLAQTGAWLSVIGVTGKEVGERVESGALTEMGSATTSQAAIGIEADQEAEKVEQPLAARTLRIAGTLTTKRHIATHYFIADVIRRHGHGCWKKYPTEIPWLVSSLV